MNQLLHCLKRNFGGELKGTETIDIFLEGISVKDLRTEESTSDIVCNYAYIDTCIYKDFIMYMHNYRAMILLHLD